MVPFSRMVRASMDNPCGPGGRARVEVFRKTCVVSGRLNPGRGGLSRPFKVEEVSLAALGVDWLVSLGLVFFYGLLGSVVIVAQVPCLIVFGYRPLAHSLRVVSIAAEYVRPDLDPVRLQVTSQSLAECIGSLSPVALL